MSNTLIIEQKLAKKYKYKPLEQELSEKYRKYFKENIPEWILCTGISGYTKKGELVFSKYQRIVIGDYGAFIEISESDMNLSLLKIKKGQEYRLDEKYKNVKYHWYTIEDGSDIKIYRQVNGVPYADYKPGMYYVSVHEIFKENNNG